MIKPLAYQSVAILILVYFISAVTIKAQPDIFDKKNILDLMYKVNNYQVEQNGTYINRNWKQSTYYTGVMAFYHSTGDQQLLEQAITWAEKNNWDAGNEMFFPANRLTCFQTYLQIFFEKQNSKMIKKAKDYLDAELTITEPAYLRGWYYADALYVGIPPFMIMTAATGEKKYSDFGNGIFWELTNQLYDKEESLFYRDSEARFNETSKNGKKVLWSRGNGWVMASIPRILSYLKKDDPNYQKYVILLQEMASSLALRQGEDGLWRTNLADYEEFPEPESSGTAFFTYAISWGINNSYLDREKYEPMVRKAWNGLCNIVNEDGKVCWGQPEARKPGKVNEEDSDEFVNGAFLLAGSEMLRLIDNKEQKN
jgi:unsaturated rhamnogalacturonyl hydrolase